MPFEGIHSVDCIHHTPSTSGVFIRCAPRSRRPKEVRVFDQCAVLAAHTVPVASEQRRSLIEATDGRWGEEDPQSR